MAHIEIQEKRGGASRLWWILGLVLLALVLWWLLARGDRDVVTENPVDVPVATTPAVGTAPATGDASAGVITDLATLTSVTDTMGLVGRRVALTGVPVRQAVSDRGFWMGSGTEPGQGVFAVRMHQSSSATAPDGAVDAGTTVNVYGTVHAMPADLTQKNTEWNLKSTDAQLLSQQKVYVLADSVQLANR